MADNIQNIIKSERFKSYDPQKQKDFIAFYFDKTYGSDERFGSWEPEKQSAFREHYYQKYGTSQIFEPSPLIQQPNTAQQNATVFSDETPQSTGTGITGKTVGALEPGIRAPYEGDVKDEKKKSFWGLEKEDPLVKKIHNIQLSQGKVPLVFTDILRDRIEDPTKWLGFIPFIGSANELKEMASVAGSAYKLYDNQELSDDELGRLIDYTIRAKADRTFWNQVAETVFAMPAFAGEFWLTGGIATFGKAATKKTIKKAFKKLLTKEGSELLEKYTKKKAGQFGVKSIANIAGETLRTPAFGIRIAKGTVERMMPEFDIKPTESGEIEAFITKDGDEWYKAFAKAFGDQWVENVSEASGFRGLSDAAKGAAIKMGIMKSFLKVNPDVKPSKFIQMTERAGYHGIIGEYMEERLGEVGRWGLGIEEYNFPSWERTGVEIVSFAIPALGRSAVEYGIRRKGKPKTPLAEAATTKEKPVADVDQPTEAKLKERVIAKRKELEKIKPEVEVKQPEAQVEEKTESTISRLETEILELGDMSPDAFKTLTAIQVESSKREWTDQEYIDGLERGIAKIKKTKAIETKSQKPAADVLPTVGKKAQTPEQIEKTKAFTVKVVEKVKVALSEAKTPEQKLTAVNRINNAVRLHVDSMSPETATELKGLAENTESELKEQGYEISDLLGKDYHDGDNIASAKFIADDTLQKGVRIISRVIKPQIMKGGKIIQFAEVEVKQGVRALTTEEFSAEKTKLEEDWKTQEKMFREMGISEDEIAKRKKNHDRYARLELEYLEPEEVAVDQVAATEGKSEDVAETVEKPDKLPFSPLNDNEIKLWNAWDALNFTDVKGSIAKNLRDEIDVLVDKVGVDRANIIGDLINEKSKKINREKQKKYRDDRKSIIESEKPIWTIEKKEGRYRLRNSEGGYLSTTPGKDAMGSGIAEFDDLTKLHTFAISHGINQSNISSNIDSVVGQIERTPAVPESGKKEAWEMTQDEVGKSGIKRKVISPNISFKEYAKQKGIEITIDHDIADFLGGVLTARTKSAKGKLKAPTKRIANETKLAEEYKQKLKSGEISSTITEVPLDLGKTSDMSYLKTVHKRSIRNAVADGKPVPIEVLRDYAGEAWADAAIAKLKGAPGAVTEAKPAGTVTTEVTEADIERRRQEELSYWQAMNRQEKIEKGRETTKKVLESLKEKYSATTFYGMVIRLMEKIIDFNTFAIINSEGLKLPLGQDATKFGALSLSEGMAMTQKSIDALLKGDAKAVKTFIHELIHSFTKNKIDEYEMEKYEVLPGYKAKLTEKEMKAISELDRIFNKAKSLFPDSDKYGFKNLYEFLAESFSNDSFQFTLKDIPSEGKKTSLFREVLDNISALIHEQLEKWSKRFNKTIPEKSEIAGIMEDIMGWAEDLISGEIIKMPFTVKEINAKYDAELEALRRRQEAQIKPAPEGKAKLAEGKVKIKAEKPEEIFHFTKSENINKILSEGFNPNLPPIHGVGALEGGAKTEKATSGVLYFTTDKGRWSTAEVYVGEGKGDITRPAFDYKTQKWQEEENAYKKINLEPVSAVLKKSSKVLRISNFKDAQEISTDRFHFIDQVVQYAKDNGYDVVNISDPGGSAWNRPDGKVTKDGKKSWYSVLTGNSGNNDYFIINKDAITVTSKAKAPESAEGKKEGKPPEMMTPDEFGKAYKSGSGRNNDHTYSFGVDDAAVERGMAFDKAISKASKGLTVNSTNVEGTLHYNLVESALSDGKPVYEGWEKDYPELEKKYGKSGAKEAWEMTQEEYIDEKSIRYSTGKNKKERQENLRKSLSQSDRLPKEHEAIILQAIKEGKPVPTDAKPVWMRTYQEYAKKHGDSDISRDEHKGEVETAIEKGKPVPESVLADYPDLAEKYDKQKPAEGEVVKPIRFEQGKKLSKSERGEVLRNVTDVYRKNKVPKKHKGVDARGEDIFGYPYSPEHFETSDITGKKVRYYVTLPDGKIAHPSELFPDIAESDINSEISRRDREDEAQRLDDATKEERIQPETDKDRANQAYKKTGRSLEGSYFASNNKGQIVRIDSKSDVDVKFFEDRGFTNKISEPVTTPPAEETLKPAEGEVETYKKGETVEISKFYSDIPEGTKGTAIKSWRDPGGTEWVKLHFGKNLGGQKLEGSFPIDVTRKPTPPAEETLAQKGLTGLSAEENAELEALKKGLVKKTLGASRTGIDPELIATAVKIGRLYFKSGIRTFAEFSGRMIKEFGDNIKPYLRQIYDGISTETEEFKQWFGKSVVVDKNGNPQKMYHGSPETDIKEFGFGRTAYGIFFAPDELSASYYTGRGGYGRVYSVYLKINNLADLDDSETFDKVAREAIFDLDEERQNQDELPLFLKKLYDDGYGKIKEVTEFFESSQDFDVYKNDIGEDYTVEEAIQGMVDNDDIMFSDVEEFIEKHGDKVPEFSRMFDRDFPLQSKELQRAQEVYGGQDFYMEYQDEFMHAAENMGYDGVVFNDPSSMGESTSYVVFSPNQVRITDEYATEEPSGLKALSAEETLAPKPGLKNLSAEENAELERRKKEVLKKTLGRASMNIDPSVVVDLVAIGNLYVKSGVRTFADFSKRMIEDLGEDVDMYLRIVYAKLNKVKGLEKLPVVDEEPKKKTVKKEKKVANKSEFVGVDVKEDMRAEATVIVKEAGREIDAQMTRVMLISMKWRKAFTEAQRGDIGAYVEGIGNINIADDTIEAVKKRMTPEMRQAANNYRLQQEKNRREANMLFDEAGSGEEYIKYLADYLGHFYINSKPKIREFAANWTKFTPHALKRKFPTLADAMEAGLTPVTQDFAYLYEKTAENNFRAAVTRRFAKKLKDMRMADGSKIMVAKQKDAGQGWVQIQHNVLRHVYARKTKDGKLILAENFAWVHPDVARPVRVILESPFSGNLAKSIHAINSAGKALNVAFSLFHEFTLAESSQGINARFLNPIRGILISPLESKRLGLGFRPRSTYKAGLMLMERDPLGIADAIRHGLTIRRHASADYARSFIEKELMRLELFGKRYNLGWVVRNPRRLFEAYNRHLWDNVHVGLKVFSYHTIVSEILANPPKNKTVKQIKEETASHINDAYGGQEVLEIPVYRKGYGVHFESATVKEKQILMALLFAPDWTFSNIRVALRPIINIKNPVSRKLGIRYWRNMTATIAGGTIGLTAAFFAMYHDDDEDYKKYPWQNESGHEWDVDVTPIKRAIQRKLGMEVQTHRSYVHAGKQAREVIRYFENFPQGLVNILGSKSSVLIRLGIEQASGHQAGSGFPMPWADSQYKEDVEGWDNLVERAKAAGEHFQPFSWQANNFAFALPLRKGMTRWKAGKYYIDAFNSFVEPGWIKKMSGATQEQRVAATRKILFEIDDALRMNGVDEDDRKMVFNAARGKVRGFYYKKFAEAFESQKLDKAEKHASLLVELDAQVDGFMTSGRMRDYLRTPEGKRKVRKIVQPLIRERKRRSTESKLSVEHEALKK